MTLLLYWTYLKTQKGPNYWYEQSFFVWCLLRQRNGGLNSGLKSATIVTDALHVDPLSLHTSMRNKQVEWHLVVHPQKDKILSYPFIYFIEWSAKGGGGLLQILISEAEEEEGVLNSKLEWIQGLPREKFIKYLDQIWYMASLDPLGSTLQGRKLCLIYFLFYWVDREGWSNCYLKFWIVKRENMNESGPAGIKVVRIFVPNSVCSCLGTQEVHLWKGTTMFGLILAL